MSLTRRKLLHLVPGALALPALPRLAHAQTFPNRPITLVVPYPPGGPTDTIARLLAERMRAPLGQPVVVENMSGARRQHRGDARGRAPGDGYTVGIGHWGSHVVNGAVYSLPVDLLTDLVPIALISEGPQLITAAKNVPAKNVTELVAWLKANPGKGHDRHDRRRRRVASCRRAVREDDRHRDADRPLSRRGAAHAGHARRHDPSGVRPGRRCVCRWCRPVRCSVTR